MIHKVMEKINKVNETLVELCLGILIFGVICQIGIIIVGGDNISYSVGLWIGIVLAICGAIHMWWSLNKALDFGEDASKIVTKHNMLRYGAVVIILGLVMITGIANPLTAFLGYMGMKVAAYIQPFTHKIVSRFLP